MFLFSCVGARNRRDPFEFFGESVDRRKIFFGLSMMENIFFFFEEEGWGVHLKQLQMLAPLGNQNSFCVSPPKLSRWTAKIK
jgi:hypothetical protein